VVGSTWACARTSSRSSTRLPAGPRRSYPGRLVTSFGFAFNGASYEFTPRAFDPAVFQGFMQALAGAVDRPVVDGSLSITPDGQLPTSWPGCRKLQVDATQARLEDALGRT